MQFKKDLVHIWHLAGDKRNKIYLAAGFSWSKIYYFLFVCLNLWHGDVSMNNINIHVPTSENSFMSWPVLVRNLSHWPVNGSINGDSVFIKFACKRGKKGCSLTSHRSIVPSLSHCFLLSRPLNTIVFIGPSVNHLDQHCWFFKWVKWVTSSPWSIWINEALGKAVSEYRFTGGCSK